jgi:dienelactone hydrolase
MMESPSPWSVAPRPAQQDADPGRVALVGFSLGGGLALERAEASTGEIKAAVDFFGYIGHDTIYKEVAKLPPTVVFHNPKDQIVAPDTSRKVLEALDKTTVLSQKFVYKLT